MCVCFSMWISICVIIYAYAHTVCSRIIPMCIQLFQLVSKLFFFGKRNNCMNASFVNNVMHKMQSTVKRSKTLKMLKMKQTLKIHREKRKTHRLMYSVEEMLVDSTQKTGTSKWFLIKLHDLFELLVLICLRVNKFCCKKPAIVCAKSNMLRLIWMMWSTVL